MTWAFLHTEPAAGMFNMAFDEALAGWLRDDPSGPSVFRLYGWNPHALSIGFHQDIEEFNAPALARAGIDLVRRPTGGKAILHANELTYSVVTTIGARGPRELYRWINEGLLCGLRRLGIEAGLSDQEPDFRALYREPGSIPCFASSSRSEIQSSGRKLIGSAQRRYGRVILQHGSFLLGPEHRRLVEFLAPALIRSTGSIAEQLAAHTIDAEAILGHPVQYAEAVEAMREGFEEHCGAPFETTLTAEMILSQHSQHTVLL
jgi:lipoate-protein ligase A